MAKPKTKKATPRPAAPSPPPAAAQTERAYELDDLAAALPAPSATLRGMLLGARSTEQNLADGTRFATDDILFAVPRIVGLALEQYTQLDAEGRALLVGFSPEVLSVLIAETLALRDQAATAASRTGAPGARLAQRRELTSRAVRARDAIHESLGRVLGSGTAHRAELDALVQDASTPTVLADGLDALAKLLRKVRDKSKPDVRDVLDGLHLGDAAVARLAGLSAELRALPTVADPRGRVDQRALDLQDGVVLGLVAHVYGAFRRANDANPAILVPQLGRLRRLFRGDARTAPAPTPPVEPPKA